jgi:hypothetical protein
MKAWRRSEPRVARPFFAVAALEGALDKTILLVGEREREIEDDVVQLDPADFDDLRVAICPRLDEGPLRDTLGERASGVSLILTLRDPMFKRRVLEKRWPVSDAIPERIALDPAKMEDFGHKRDLQVTLALVQDADVAPAPGWPSRRGAWIAKRTFRIKLRSIRSTFDLQPMSREQAAAWTGFAGALLHVEYNDGRLLEEPDEDNPLATCFIAQDVYDAMQRVNDGPALQDIVMTEVIAAVLALAVDDVEAATEAPRGTPLATILEQLWENQPMPLSELKKRVRDPVKLRAAVHDRTDLVRQLRSL